jgi:S-adenosyl methyltransferase
MRNVFPGLYCLRMTGFDPKSPNVARVYDYGLGGRENFAADREAAVRLLTGDRRRSPPGLTASRAGQFS